MAHDDSPNEDHSSSDSSKKPDEKKKQKASSELSDTTLSTVKTCKELKDKPGVHSINHMFAAGFKYTGEQDSAICKDCGFKASDWKIEKKPFAVHSEQNPNCPFVRAVKFSALPRISTTTTGVQSTSIASVETDALQQVRRRTFSHWPHRTLPSRAQMIEAGFFRCNVGDRVICIYCNLICQQWTPHTDDPCEVHKTLSPNCPYVTEKLIRSPTSSILITNENPARTTSSNHPPTVNNPEPLRSNEIVFTAACHPTYNELSKRWASFATWPNENSPSVDDLAKAGFFYTGTKNIVTCFYCNGSLQNWGPNDNPTIEHARWFPHCAYAKQLCGDYLYRKIQEAKRARQERARGNETGKIANSDVMLKNNGQLFIPDESTLSRFVAARLDLPISQHLLNRNFKLSIIKRCWEDQLRLKQEDFVSEHDLFIACLILKKQIQYIDGKKENITIPSIKMKQIRDQEERTCEQSPTAVNATQSAPDTTDAYIVASPKSLKKETKFLTINDENQSNDSIPANPCVLCLTEEKRLACIPCGHLATCVPCGHALRSCPICRREIEAFVRIYL